MHRPATRSRIVSAGSGVGVGVLASILFSACGVSPGNDASDAPGAVATAPTAGEETSTRDPVAPPMTRSEPVRVRVPRIDVDSRLMRLGLQRDGTLAVPPSGFPAGWYTGAPTAGERGPAIIVGHVRWGKRARGVLGPAPPSPWRRDPGHPQGQEHCSLQGEACEHVAKVDFPTDRVYGHLAHAGLRLITCGGFNKETRTYDDNIIVFADLTGTRGG